jgi:hypothetical protein
MLGTSRGQTGRLRTGRLIGRSRQPEYTIGIQGNRNQGNQYSVPGPAEATAALT